MSLQIFMSYSHKDIDFANKLTKRLEHEGYDIWLDRTDIETGSRWDDEIVKGLNASQVFIVLLSDTSVVSQNVKDEIGYAVDHDKHIIPLLIKPCEVPFRLRRMQFVDFTAIRYEEGIQSVVENLRSAWPDAEVHPKKKERKLMDPATLAAAVTGLLVPLLAKMGESAIEEVGAKLPEKLGNLWLAVSNRFHDNATAFGAASDLARNSKDTENQQTFALQLRKVLKEDPSFANILAELLKEAQDSIGKEGNENIVVGTIRIEGDLSGNLIVGKNNQIGDHNQNVNTP